ncbi:hypothetical protein KAT36_01140 [Candidatus Pacearchaeota archaeon]|nr:hypothetical protein [Candidatus Pacearchaeota archaeon]
MAGKCEKEIKISFCPKCKSRDVKYVFELGNLFGVIPKMKCGNCGFDSVSFPVLTISEEELKRAGASRGIRKQVSGVRKTGTTKKKVAKKKVVKKKSVKMVKKKIVRRKK